MLPLWSTWYFFSLYANAGGARAATRRRWRTDSTDVLDRYMLAHDRATWSRDVTADLEGFDSTARRGEAARLRRRAHQLVRPPLARPVLGGRGRRPTQPRGVRHALHRARDAARASPRRCIPLVTERGLAGPHRRPQRAPRRTGPTPTRSRADDDLVAAMDAVREIASRRPTRCASSAGCACACRSRSLTVVTRGCRGARASSRTSCATSSTSSRVELVELDERRRRGVRHHASGSRVNARAAGPRLGKQVQQAIQAATAGDWTVDGDGVVAGGIALEPGEYELVLEAGGSARGRARSRCCRRRLRAARHHDDARARGRGPRARRHPRRAGHAQGRRLDVSDRIRLGLTLDDAGRRGGRLGASRR